MMTNVGDLRVVLGANDGESTIDAARRVVDELIEYRGAVEGAFGVVTAAPRATLMGIASEFRDHHRAHHERERTAWTSLRALAIAHLARASERAADEALAALDEQGMPA